MAHQKLIEDTFLEVLREDRDERSIDDRFKSFDSRDWKELYELLIKSRLFPAFYVKIQDLANVPSEIIAELKSLYLFNLKQSIISERELFSVIAHLEKKSIAVIPLKGAIFAEYIHSDLALRRASCDLDILVRPKNFSAAVIELKTLGYEICQGFEEGRKYNYKLKYAKQIRFQKKDREKTLFLELHSEIRGMFTNVSSEKMWDALREIMFNEQKIKVFSDEDIVLYLSLLTLSVTDFIEIKYVYELHLFWTKFKDRLDLKKLIDRANDTGHKPVLFFAFILCVETFNTDVPKKFIQQIQPGCIKKFIVKRWINKKNALRNIQENVLSPFFRYGWYYFISSYLYAKNPFEAISLTYRKIFLPKEDLLIWYGDESNQNPSLFIYLKRLLRPIVRMIPTTKRRP